MGSVILMTTVESILVVGLVLLIAAAVAFLFVKEKKRKARQKALAAERRKRREEALLQHKEDARNGRLEEDLGLREPLNDAQRKVRDKASDLATLETVRDGDSNTYQTGKNRFSTGKIGKEKEALTRVDEPLKKERKPSEEEKEDASIRQIEDSGEGAAEDFAGLSKDFVLEEAPAPEKEEAKAPRAAAEAAPAQAAVLTQPVSDGLTFEIEPRPNAPFVFEERQRKMREAEGLLETISDEEAEAIPMSFQEGEEQITNVVPADEVEREIEHVRQNEQRLLDSEMEGKAEEVMEKAIAEAVKAEAVTEEEKDDGEELSEAEKLAREALSEKNLAKIEVSETVRALLLEEAAAKAEEEKTPVRESAPVQASAGKTEEKPDLSGFEEEDFAGLDPDDPETIRLKKAALRKAEREARQKEKEKYAAQLAAADEATEDNEDAYDYEMSSEDEEEKPRGGGFRVFLWILAAILSLVCVGAVLYMMFGSYLQPLLGGMVVEKREVFSGGLLSELSKFLS